MTVSPPAFRILGAEFLEPDAGPAYGSRLSLGTLLGSCSRRSDSDSTGRFPSPEQPSVSGGWLNLAIQFFRFKLRRLGRRTWGTFTPGFARLLWAHHNSSLIIHNFRLSALLPPSHPSHPSQTASTLGIRAIGPVPNPGSRGISGRFRRDRARHPPPDRKSPWRHRPEPAGNPMSTISISISSPADQNPKIAPRVSLALLALATLTPLLVAP